MVGNTVKTCSHFDVQAVICRKRSAFEMQFHITEVSMFSKTCVKNHEDTSCRLLDRRI